MNREYPNQPLIGVGVIVWRNNRVLLIRRGKPPRKDQWSLPGGLQKLGETVFEAARREVMEETGVEIRVFDLTDVVDLIERDGDDGPVRYHYTLIDVVAGWLRGEAVAGTDAAEVVWADIEALPRYRLWSETERVIRRAHESWRESGWPQDKEAQGRI